METTARAQHTTRKVRRYTDKNIEKIEAWQYEIQSDYLASGAEAEANRRIIEAAPVLLGALEDILIYHGDKLPVDLRDVAEYAIRQTRGEA